MADKAMEAAARAFNPELFSDPTLYTESASALRDVEDARASILVRLERAITAWTAEKAKGAGGVVERLQVHVISRGGLSRDSVSGAVNLPNGAWAMMLEAADTILALSAENERMKAELKWVKEQVCGDVHPRWSERHHVTQTRYEIANRIDAALGDAP